MKFKELSTGKYKTTLLKSTVPNNKEESLTIPLGNRNWKTYSLYLSVATK